LFSFGQVLNYYDARLFVFSIVSTTSIISPGLRCPIFTYQKFVLEPIHDFVVEIADRLKKLYPGMYAEPQINYS
jgi:hypothetical protein